MGARWGTHRTEVEVCYVPARGCGLTHLKDSARRIGREAVETRDAPVVAEERGVERHERQGERALAGTRDGERRGGRFARRRSAAVEGETGGRVAVRGARELRAVAERERGVQRRRHNARPVCAHVAHY